MKSNQMIKLFSLLLLFLVTTLNVYGQCTPPNLEIKDLVNCTPKSIDLKTAVQPGSDPANLTFYNTQANANSKTNAISPILSATGSYWVRAEDPNDPSCYKIYEIKVNRSSTFIEKITTCEPYTWPNTGITYPYSHLLAVDTIFGGSVEGCDSIVKLDLTVSQKVETTDVIYSCGEYTWIDGKTYKTSNNSATMTLTNSVGCDSIVKLDLTIKNSTGIMKDTIKLDTTICANESFTYNGKVYTKSGIYYDTLAYNSPTVPKNINYGNSEPVGPVSNPNYGWGRPVLYYDYTPDGASVNHGGGYTFTKLEAPFWRGNGNVSNSIVNKLGVWNNSTIPLNQWYGSTFTVIVPVSKIYYIVLVGDNSFRFTLNGDVKITSDGVKMRVGEGSGSGGAATVPFTWLHIYPIYLTAGCHDVTLEGNRSSGFGMFGGAILDNTDAEIAAATQNSDLNYIFSTEKVNVFYRNLPSATCPAGYEPLGPTLCDECIDFKCETIVEIDLRIEEVTTENISDSICAGDTYTLHGNSFDTEGIHKGILKNTSGCDSLEYILDLTIMELPTGTDVQGACDSYEWIDGNTYTSSNNTATYTIPNGGANGCDSIVTLDLTIIESPEVDAGIDIAICPGDTVILTAINPDNATITWDNGVVDGVEFYPTIEGTTTYTVIAAIDSCTTTDQVQVIVFPTPDISFTADPTEGGGPLDVIFENTSTGSNTYWWDFDDGSSEQNNDILVYHTFENDGDYNTILIGMSQDGCLDTAMLVITVLPPEMSYEFPNVFTPNGDNQNDMFLILDPKFISSIEIIIVNRWGNLVFESDDLNFSWNGNTLNSGAECADGTYFYKAKLTDLYGKTVEEHGHITLVREK